MFTWLLLTASSVLGAEPGNHAGPSSGMSPARPGSPAKTAQLRHYHEYEKDCTAALRAEALAGNRQERAAAIRRLTALFRELRTDPRLETSDTLQGYKAQLSIRLARVRADLKRQLEREAKVPKRADEAAEAQILQQATQSLGDQMNTLNYSLGGPAYVLAQTGGALGGGTITDNGWELVQLIEHTINPTFWESAGGPGSIFYYQPLMALVVRATSEVHSNVAGLVEALRRAGN